ncbi:MAG: hypothetical protein U5L09_07240 [Bacteroidales bacterium]|nr:hypothetical protein [Bacteroidales bacterium]
MKPLWRWLKNISASGKKFNGFELTKDDHRLLKHAYGVEFGSKERRASLDAMAVAYTGDHPFSSQVVMLVNEKSGLSFTTNSHTAQAVPVKVQGAGASLFSTYLDNTDISKMIEVLLIKTIALSDFGRTKLVGGGHGKEENLRRSIPPEKYIAG